MPTSTVDVPLNSRELAFIGIALDDYYHKARKKYTNDAKMRPSERAVALAEITTLSEKITDKFKVAKEIEDK